VQEHRGLLRRAESEDRLDRRPVVPGAVEDRHLAARRQMRDIELEIPLAGLGLGRPRQGDDPGEARVQMLRQPLDNPAFPRGVAALEDDDEALPLALDPILHLDQLDLELAKLRLVGFFRELPVVGKMARAERGVRDLRGQRAGVEPKPRVSGGRQRRTCLGAARGRRSAGHIDRPPPIPRFRASGNAAERGLDGYAMTIFTKRFHEPA